LNFKKLLMSLPTPLKESLFILTYSAKGNPPDKKTGLRTVFLGGLNVEEEKSNEGADLKHSRHDD